MKKSTLLISTTSIVAAAAAIFLSTQTISGESSPENTNNPLITVYKSATCGCCKKWVSYLEREGFEVNSINHDDVDSIKAQNGLTDPSLKSCHTALVDGYIIEGHVPVSDIKRLLSEKPKAVGLTAPGMPMMSPGMNSIEPKDYDVLLFQKDGTQQVYSSY